MTYVGITHNEYRDGVTDEELTTARTKFAAALKEQPGFQSYTVVKTGDRSATVISFWDSESVNEQSTATIRSHAEEIFGDIIVDSESHGGELVYST